MADRKYGFLLQFTTSDDDSGIHHVDASIIYPDPHGNLLCPSDPTPPPPVPYLTDFRVSAYLCGTEDRAWGYFHGYHRPYRVDRDVAEAMVRTLRKIDKSLEKPSNTTATPKTSTTICSGSPGFWTRRPTTSATPRNAPPSQGRSSADSTRPACNRGSATSKPRTRVTRRTMPSSVQARTAHGEPLGRTCGELTLTVIAMAAWSYPTPEQLLDLNGLDTAAGGDC